MKSKGVRCHGYRLSPNEEARLIKEETEKRRKLRLLQVRELSKTNAAVIRQSVKAEKQKQIGKLARKVEKELESVKEEKVRSLEARYDNCVRSIGMGHKDASHQEDTTESREALSEENSRRADSRFRQALDTFRAARHRQHMEENYHILARKIALDAEKERANQIAALPPPPPDPILQLQQAKHKPVKMTDTNAFSTTHYHLPQDIAVERANTFEQGDARASAAEEAERIKDEQYKVERVVHEYRERARVRHNIAREKELLRLDYDDMLHDLSDLQRADMHRRQKQVANIPKQVFQPPHRRLEDRHDKQRHLEDAFEDMYMRATAYTGDISLALDPHAALETPTATEDLELSAVSDTGHTLHPPVSMIDRPQPLPPLQPAEILKDVTNIATDPPSPKKSVLKKLFSQIKSQRDDWVSRSCQDVPEPENLTSVSPQAEAPGGGVQHSSTDIERIPRTAHREEAEELSQGGQPGLSFPHQLSPPVREAAPAQLSETDDTDVSPQTSHEDKLQQAVQELREIQEKKAALEDRLRQFSTQQQTTAPVDDQAQLHADIKTTPDDPEVATENFDFQGRQQTGEVGFSSLSYRPQKLASDDFLPRTTATHAFSGHQGSSLIGDVRFTAEPTYLQPLSLTEDSSSDARALRSTEEVSLDNVRKIKEYQQKLLDRHQSWKMLAETRAEIEKRRSELKQRYPQLNLPKIESLPLPSLSSALSHGSVVTTFGVSKRDVTAQPLSDVASSLPLYPRPTLSNQKITQPSSETGPELSKVEAKAKDFDARIGANILAGYSNALNEKGNNLLPKSELPQTSSDQVRKQLLFDSETPATSPQKTTLGQPSGANAFSDLNKFRREQFSPQKTDTDLEREPQSHPSISHTRSSSAKQKPETLPIAVPLGRSHVRRSFEVSPQSTTHSSLDYSGADTIAALTTAAEERKRYFEKRQQQLTQQLEEIQKQKAQYLKQHDESQDRVKEQRQRMIRDLVHQLPLDENAFSGKSASDIFQRITTSRDTDVADYGNKQEASRREYGANSQVSLHNLSSVSETDSRKDRTWADILHESMDSSHSETEIGHQQHELSTILEVDTPSQTRSRLTDDKGSNSLGRHLSQFQPGPSITHQSLGESKPSAVPDPPSYQSVLTKERSEFTENDDHVNAYEPLATGMTIRRIADPATKTMREANAAVARAYELLAQTSLPSQAPSDAGHENLYEDASPFVGQSNLEFFKLAPQMASGLEDTDWRLRSTEIGQDFSSRSSDLTQYTASVDSRQAGALDLSRKSKSLSPNGIRGSGLETGLIWKSDHRMSAPSGISELTQLSSSSSNISDKQASSGKSLFGKLNRADLVNNQMSSSDILRRTGSLTTDDNSPSGTELTQYSLQTDRLPALGRNQSLHDSTRDRNSPVTEISRIPSNVSGSSLLVESGFSVADQRLSGSLPRPESAHSPSGSGLTQYTISPTLPDSSNPPVSAFLRDENREYNLLQRPKSAESIPGSQLTQHTNSPSENGHSDSLPRPKSAESRTGFELTQYAYTPILPETTSNESESSSAVKDYSSKIENFRSASNSTGVSASGLPISDSSQSKLGGEELRTGAPGYNSLTDRRVVSSRESSMSGPINQLMSGSLPEPSSSGESGQISEVQPLSFTKVSQLSDLSDFNENNSVGTNSRLLNQEVQNSGVSRINSIQQTNQDVQSDGANETPDIFRAVKVFIEPPNGQSSPHGTEASGQDRTWGSTISQSQGTTHQSGPSESSSYMTLPPMNRTSLLERADFSTLTDSFPGEFKPKGGKSGLSGEPSTHWKEGDYSAPSQSDTSMAEDLRKWKDHLNLGTPEKSHISEEDTGITEEPDLTLVTLASVNTPSRSYNDSQSDSLMSFENHEASVEFPTPRVKSDEAQNDVVLYLTKDAAQGEKTSLQDAFLSRRKDFAEASEQRVQKVKEKSKEAPIQNLTQTLLSWKKSRSMRGNASSKSTQKKIQTQPKTKTTPDRKQEEKEKIERTKRLYNQLEEVRDRNVVVERERQYAANRDRAKQYHKQMQEKLKKQRSAKK